MFCDEHTNELNYLYNDIIKYFRCTQFTLKLTFEAFVMRMYLSYIKK